MGAPTTLEKVARRNMEAATYEVFILGTRKNKARRSCEREEALRPVLILTYGYLAFTYLQGLE